MSARRALLVLALAAALVGWAGKNPEPPHAGFQFIPQSASFVTPSLGWAWGPTGWPRAEAPSRGVLARTGDGGRHWKVIRTPRFDYAQPGSGPGIAGVRFIDAERGYLFGSQLLVTSDGGTDWRRIPVTGRILDLQIADGQAYALGLNCAGCSTAHLYRIGPRGLVRILRQTAVSASASLTARGRSVYLLAPRRVGLGTRLWASNDMGHSWEVFRSPCVWPGAAALTAWSSRGLALACGSQPAAGSQAKTFYASSDGGRLWRLVGRIPFGPGYVASLAAPDAATWVLEEARGQIELSIDGGHRWRYSRLLGRAAPVEGWGSVSFVDSIHGVAVPWTLNGDVVAFTSDGGRSWWEVAFGWRP